MGVFETENKVRRQDLEALVSEGIFDDYKSSAIMVTGATGLIGSEIVLAALCANRIKGLNIKIVALVRNIEKANRMFKSVLEDKNLQIIEQDINTRIEYAGAVDYIIHTASVTSSEEITHRPVETILTTINGTKNVLDYASQKSVKGIIYLSSIEVYGKILSDTPVSESELGYLDLLNPRSSYTESKRAAENLCASYFYECKLPVKIARLTQTFGAGISRDENRLFAQIARSVIDKKDIVLHTQGLSAKSYCYITDAIEGILTVLKKGESAKAYNIANPKTFISVKDMAQRVAEKYGVSVKFDIDKHQNIYHPDIKINPDTTLLEQLGWKEKVELDEMYERLIKGMENE